MIEFSRFTCSDLLLFCTVINRNAAINMLRNY